MWQELEKSVREIASLRWKCRATTEIIAGVKCDCILHISDEETVAVEITQQHNINKIRKDISNLDLVKHALFNNDGIFTRCYIVLEKTPTDAMREAGKASKVKVLSIEEFKNEFFNYSGYVYARKNGQFGSLVNAKTGEPEKDNVFINVSYMNLCKERREIKKSSYTLSEMKDQLRKGRRIVLKGDFGLGKSRCIKQIFSEMTTESSSISYVLAINLRNHWGAVSAKEILDRHFSDLGINGESFINNFLTDEYMKLHVILLLDGFDEIGTQSWFSDKQAMQHTRAMSLRGVKQLISISKGGVLISGRDYYFNSDEEMFEALGLDSSNTLKLGCKTQFSDEELSEYLEKNLSSRYLDQVSSFPFRWIPKRPLVIQYFLTLIESNQETLPVFNSNYTFWNYFFNEICRREASINPAISQLTVKRVMLLLADLTRRTQKPTGPITQGDLSDVFKSVTGVFPNDESALMLQRLPSIGRISADSPDREFHDGYILNGLRAQNIINLYFSYLKSTTGDGSQHNASYYGKRWNYCLELSGLEILSDYIDSNHLTDNFISFAKFCLDRSLNHQLVADIIAALCLTDTESLDFRGISIDYSEFTVLSFKRKKVFNLTLRNCTVYSLDLTNSNVDNSVSFPNTDIGEVAGVSSVNGVPEWLESCKQIKKFEYLHSNSAVRKGELSVPHRMLIEILRKLFLEPGSGRQESTLTRGMGQSADKKLAKQIIRILIDEEMITYYKADSGKVYKPNRNQQSRVDSILSDLTLSSDSIWDRVSRL
ncbi:hypothetical protein [Olsenella sp. An290]|uniref:hypothetical protein n=1 Tax=Olsenella sp. An290 TaxID=1965625 RepID=UPI00117FA264|nr:hypothetical protein [Olsenella sp. An290]